MSYINLTSGYRRSANINNTSKSVIEHVHKARTINVASDSGQSEEFLELANGCLCCSIKDTGVAAIEQLMKRKGAFDHILLETTGLADPGEFALSFVDCGL